MAIYRTSDDDDDDDDNDDNNNNNNNNNNKCKEITVNQSHKPWYDRVPKSVGTVRTVRLPAT